MTTGRAKARPVSLRISFLDQRQNILIRRAEIEVGNLRREDPLQIMMLQEPRRTVGNGAMEEAQTDQNIGIFMDYLGEQFTPSVMTPSAVQSSTTTRPRACRSSAPSFSRQTAAGILSHAVIISTPTFPALGHVRTTTQRCASDFPRSIPQQQERE